MAGQGQGTAQHSTGQLHGAGHNRSGQGPTGPVAIAVMGCTVVGGCCSPKEMLQGAPHRRWAKRGNGRLLLGEGRVRGGGSIWLVVVVEGGDGGEVCDLSRARRWFGTA